MPVAAKLCIVNAKAKVNEMINFSIDKVLDKDNIKSCDLIDIEEMNGVIILSANTKNINLICADLNDCITDEIRKEEDYKIKVPYGTATGLNALSNIGPDISFNMKPEGEVEIDYYTEFNSAGINQTNYKIWLTVSITVSLINPIYDRKVTMRRKIMLVDTIIKGEVPPNYISPLNDE